MKLVLVRFPQQQKLRFQGRYSIAHGLGTRQGRSEEGGKSEAVR
jgi:hypothetical protein